MPKRRWLDQNRMLQKDLHEFITNDLSARFPKGRIISNQPLDHGLRADFAVEDRGPKHLTALVEVKLGRTAPEDIMRASFYRMLIKGPGRRDIRVLVYSPVFPSKVRELARIADVELMELPERFFTSSVSAKNIKITGKKAWAVIVQILRTERSTIRQTSIRSGTSFGWTHAVFVQLQRSGIMERQGNAYIVGDIPRLLDGLGWERPLPSLIVKEWNTSSAIVKDVLSDIVIADKDAVLTGYLASEGLSDYSRRTDIVQVYSAQAERLQRQLGSSDKGVRIQVLRPDRVIPVRQMSAGKGHGIRFVSMDQLILDLAGLGIPARDILLNVLKGYRGTDNG